MHYVKVLVTGSRKWPDLEAAREMVFNDLYAILREDVDIDGTLVVVHGQSPGDGVDLFAKQFCQEASPWAIFMGKTVIEDPHPPNYKRYGNPNANFVRNQEMVDGKPSYVLAYQYNNSRGTQDTIDRANKAGLEVILKSY